MTTEGRLLGIDYGSKRIGTACSDEEGFLAFPHSVIENDNQLIDKLLALVEEKDIKTIVIGHSKDRDGSDNTIHRAVIKLIDKLSARCNLPIHLEPEQYTTQAALRIQGRTTKTDAAAAALILDSFIARKVDNKVD